MRPAITFLNIQLSNSRANNYYKEIIKENIDKLYNRKSFPVDEIDSVQSHL